MRTPYLIIQDKRDGRALPASEIRSFISGYVQGEIPDYQMSAFLMAVFFRGMTAEETAALTQAMMDSGDKISPDLLGDPTADKHSTGGVGDKISIPLAPLVAAAGVRVPMMSGRGLGHTGGTLDKLESIPGFNTQLETGRMIAQLHEIGVVMIGQTQRMVPADKKMYALRDVTATVDCIPLIAASIMSKKIAAGPRNLVLDVKVGRGAFMKDRENATRLAQAMVDIGSAHGRNVQAVLTDMHTQPLGRAVGNSLEIIESVEILQGKGPSDIRELTLTLAAPMLVMAGTDADESAARTRLEQLLDSGQAYQKFIQLVEAQGGDSRAVTPPFTLPLGEPVTLEAPESGYIRGIDPMTIGLAGIELGAGRIRQDDVIDPGVGFKFTVQTGDSVEKGDPLVTVFVNRQLDPELKHRIVSAFEFTDKPVQRPAPVLDRIYPGKT